MPYNALKYVIFMIYHDSTNISTSPFIELNNFLNWIIFWIEFLWNSIELNIELNHFLAKFKYWIESIWVSFTPIWIRSSALLNAFDPRMAQAQNSRFEDFILWHLAQAEAHRSSSMDWSWCPYVVAYGQLSRHL